MFSFWNFFLHKRAFSYLLLALFFTAGLYSIFVIPKESAPEVRIPIGIVSTGIPGASAEDVEILVTNKIEQKLRADLEDVKTITSTTREGFTSVVVEFEASADLDSSIRKLRDAVDATQSELPSDALDLVVTEVNFSDQPIMTIVLSGSGSLQKIKQTATFFKDEIEKTKGVSRVESIGVQDEEVQIIVSQEALKTYNLSITDVARALDRNNASLPAGNIIIENTKYAIKFEGDITDLEEIANLPILSKNNRPIYVRDIANVRVGFAKADTISRLSVEGSIPQNAISFLVYKRSGGDITKITQTVREKVTMLESTGVLGDLSPQITFDAGALVKEDLVSLSSTGLQTVILVMLILFVALGWREAIIAGLAIPLSFFVGFIGLSASGNTLNFVSLFSLILAVGILVDSAIVIVEGIHTRMKNWEDKIEAAKNTIKEYHYPVTAGTLTTVAVFAPLFLVSGITGQFIASIPFTIIFVLLASLFVALGTVPLIASTFLKRSSTSQFEKSQEARTEKIVRWYKKHVLLILGNKRREKIFMWSIIGLFFISFLLPITGLVKVTFFDQDNVDNLYVDIELPQGTTLARSSLEAQKVEGVLLQDSRITDFTTIVGQGSPFNGNAITDSKLSNIQITLKKKRKEDSTKILEQIRTNLSTITTSDIRVSEPSSGPPTGSAIEIQVRGENQESLNRAGQLIKKTIQNIPGTKNVRTSNRNNTPQFVLTVDRAKTITLGLTPVQIATILRTSITGVDATTVPGKDTDINIVVKANLAQESLNPHETNRATLQEVRQLQIQSPQGPVLLGSLVKEKYSLASGVIQHKDGTRILTISADITSTGNARKITGLFLKEKKNLDLPKDVTVTIGGESDESNKAFVEMLLSLIVGLMAMLAILVLQFNSFRYALYVLSIVPFSLIGIFFGLMISGKALSFPSIMGFIALTGIVVNNSIILIDVMNNIRRKNPEKSILEVVIEGASLRLRPIILTTLTTVIGIIPLTFASELWAPLAFAIIFGLSFSVILTLVLIPIIYRRWPGKLRE